MRTTPMKILILAAVLGLGLVMVTGITESAAAEEGAQLYTSHNIWYEHAEKIWSTNYQKGQLLPAGTPVKSVKSSRKYVRFTDAETDVTYTVYFVAKHHPGKTMRDIVDRFLTDKSFEQLTEGFSESEIEAIKDGSVVNGMSREAVVVSYGYPPEISTPSTKVDNWTYWRHRFKSFTIDFDGDGKVEFVGS